MSNESTPSPAGRATALFVAEPTAHLQCSHCGGEVTDDDADCPTCTTPLDWGASRVALQEWYAHSTA